jgi:hypothetical protein
LIIGRRTALGLLILSTVFVSVLVVWVVWPFLVRHLW